MGVKISLGLRRRLTALVWLSGLVVAMIMIAQRPAGQIRALAWAEPVVVAAPDDGTLLELGVTLHQSVAAGDIVGRLDSDQLTARGDVLEAELESLQQKENSSEQGRTRRFELDRESAALELAKLSATVEEGRARAAALRERLAIDERLVAEGVAPIERAGDVRRELGVVEARLSADRDRLRLARKGAARTGVRAAAAVGPNQWQIVTARRRLAELEARRQRLVLRSSTSGQITQVFTTAGEWLKAGEPVLRISPVVASEVHAWLDSHAAPDVRAGMSAEVRRSTGETLTGTVTSVGVERLPLPKELWLRGNAPEWGYLARIELAAGSLSPGEPVEVGLRDLNRLASVTSGQG